MTFKNTNKTVGGLSEVNRVVVNRAVANRIVENSVAVNRVTEGSILKNIAGKNNVTRGLIKMGDIAGGMIIKGIAASIVVSSVAAMLPGCHSLSPDESSPALTLYEHPLVDKIWQVKSKQYADKPQLLNAIANSDYILLGETHDNPLHHQYQAWVIQQLSAQGRKMAVAFEMLTPDQELILNGMDITSAEQIFDAVQWDKSGWPSKEIYKPVFDAAIAAGYPIVAANIDRKELGQIVMQGETKLPENIKAQLKVNPLSEEDEALLRKGIVESHCNMLPESMVPAMMLGQRVRDASIANSLLANKKTDGIVLIAGSGHTQKRGVPVFIRSADKSAKILSMAWMEVDQRFNTPQEYSEYWGGAELPFDYVWFTARIDRPDPCEELKKHPKFSKHE